MRATVRQFPYRAVAQNKAWANSRLLTACAALSEEEFVGGRNLRLLAVIDGLEDKDLDRIVSVDRGTRIRRDRMDRSLLHLYQHQIHHRGQAHAMLNATSVQPPQQDEFFPVAWAPLRADEFGVLGWTENEVWGNQRN